MSEKLHPVLQILALIAFGVLVACSLREATGILAIARQTWKESIRKKVLWLVVIFGGALIVSTIYVAAAGTEVTREERRLRSMIEISFRVMGLLTILSTVCLTSVSLPGDISSRNIFTLLSKPISRWGLLVGKILGFCAVSIVMLGLMAVSMIVVIKFRAAEVPSEVEERLLGAREICSAAKFTLMTWRDANVSPSGLDMVMRPEIPDGSMFRFNTGPAEGLPQGEQIPARFRFQHFRDTDGKLAYTPQELANCRIVFDIIEPQSKAHQRMEVRMNPEDGVSEEFRVPRHFVSSGSLGIEVATLVPATRSSGKTSYLRERESGKWEFSRLSRRQLETDPQKAEQASGGPDDSSAKKGGPPWITVQARLRILHRGGGYASSKSADLMVYYELPGGQRDSVLAKARDNRAVRFQIPLKALHDDGTVQLKLENPIGTTEYFGYDNEKYGLVLLSRPQTFEFNVLKAVFMLSFQVMLLIIITVAGSTFLSWPVALLSSVFVYYCGSIMAFIGDMIETTGPGLLGGDGHGHGHEEPLPEWLSEAVRGVLRGLRMIVPDMEKFSPLSLIGEGYSVSLGELTASFSYMCIFASVALVVGWLIFRNSSVE